MTLQLASTPSPKIDPAELFRKLGLHRADERPILEAFRQANMQWRLERLRRAEAHAQRIVDHLRRFRRPVFDAESSSRSKKGKPRPVWCVELRLQFASMTEAARFVKRKPSNISQALLGGGRCAKFHWEIYDPKKHQ